MSLRLNHIAKMVAELRSNKMAAELRNHRLTNEYKQASPLQEKSEGA